MSPKRKSKEPLVIGLIETAMGLVVIGSVAIAMCLMMGVFELPEWAKWLTFAMVIVGGTALGFFLLHLALAYREAYHEKAGDGLRALEGTIKEADRTIRADIFEVTDDFQTALSGSPMSGGYREVHVPWTRIRVSHRGKIPCVVEVVNGNIKRMRFFDKDAYMEWRNQQKDHRKVPKKVKIWGRKVATAYPSKMIPSVLHESERIFDEYYMAKVKGIIRIEPDQVVFMQMGDPLEGENLKMVTYLLSRLATNTENYFK